MLSKSELEGLNEVYKQQLVKSRETLRQLTETITELESSAGSPLASDDKAGEIERLKTALDKKVFC